MAISENLICLGKKSASFFEVRFFSIDAASGFIKAKLFSFSRRYTQMPEAY